VRRLVLHSVGIIVVNVTCGLVVLSALDPGFGVGYLAVGVHGGCLDNHSGCWKVPFRGLFEGRVISCEVWGGWPIIQADGGRAYLANRHRMSTSEILE
jgi:hypothetical protein